MVVRLLWHILFRIGIAVAVLQNLLYAYIYLIRFYALDGMSQEIIRLLIASLDLVAFLLLGISLILFSGWKSKNAKTQQQLDKWIIRIKGKSIDIYKLIGILFIIWTPITFFWRLIREIYSGGAFEPDIFSRDAWGPISLFSHPLVHVLFIMLASLCFLTMFVLLAYAMEKDEYFTKKRGLPLFYTYGVYHGISVFILAPVLTFSGSINFLTLIQLAQMMFAINILIVPYLGVVVFILWELNIRNEIAHF